MAIWPGSDFWCFGACTWSTWLFTSGWTVAQVDLKFEHLTALKQVEWVTTGFMNCWVQLDQRYRVTPYSDVGDISRIWQICDGATFRESHRWDLRGVGMPVEVFTMLLGDKMSFKNVFKEMKMSTWTQKMKGVNLKWMIYEAARGPWHRRWLTGRDLNEARSPLINENFHSFMTFHNSCIMLHEINTFR